MKSLVVTVAVAVSVTYLALIQPGWAATFITLYGSWLVGEKSKRGFLCQIVGNTLWALVGVCRGMQYDLIFVSLAFVVLYVRNYAKWTKEEKAKLQNDTANA